MVKHFHDFIGISARTAGIVGGSLSDGVWCQKPIGRCSVLFCLSVDSVTCLA